MSRVGPEGRRKSARRRREIYVRMDMPSAGHATNNTSSAALCHIESKTHVPSTRNSRRAMSVAPGAARGHCAASGSLRARGLRGISHPSRRTPRCGSQPAGLSSSWRCRRPPNDAHLESGPPKASSQPARPGSGGLPPEACTRSNSRRCLSELTRLPQGRRSERTGCSRRGTSRPEW